MNWCCMKAVSFRANYTNWLMHILDGYDIQCLVLCGQTIFDLCWWKRGSGHFPIEIFYSKLPDVFNRLLNTFFRLSTAASIKYAGPYFICRLHHFNAQLPQMTHTAQLPQVSSQ